MAQRGRPRLLQNVMAPRKSNVNFSEGNKSKGILDDFAVRKNIDTAEGTVQKVPTNPKDIVNKEYADGFIGGHTPEGTAVLSTGETGAVKFLREDGDGTSSWQPAPTGTVTSVNTQTGAIVLDTDDINEGITNEYYTEAKVTANTSVTANTAKTGITSQQATDITTNNAKTSYTDATAVSLNTAKVTYPSADSTKLAGIEELAEVNNISDVNATDLTDAGETTLHSHAAIANNGLYKQSNSTFTDNDTAQTFTDAFVTTSSLVIVTLTGSAPAGTWSVVSNAGSFTITSTATESTDITFDYYVLKA